MGIHRFEDLIAWQKGQDLAIDVYKNFNTCKDWEFRNQLTRAVVSISNNIAEGFDRNTNREFKQFLHISRASCSEVKSMLYLARRLGYLPDDNAVKLINQSVEISRIINGLIKSIK